MKQKLSRLRNAVNEREDLRNEISKAGRPPHCDFWHQSIWCADKKIEEAYNDLKSDFMFK